MGAPIDYKIVKIPETRPEKLLKKMALFATTAFFIFTGLRHLLIPEFYMTIMPSYFPVPLFLIYLSGILQIVCATGLLFLKTRKWAAYGLMVFLLTSLPVLIFLWTYKESLPIKYIPSWVQVLSIPLQFALIFWVYLFSKNPKSY